jgi:hypothetical protein
VGVTSNDIANQAIVDMGGNQPAVTGQAPNFDNSTAGLALQKLYAPTVQTVAKQFGWDFTRAAVALQPTGNNAPLGYAFEYLYPANGIEVFELQPQPIADFNNPLPVNWTIGNDVVGGTQSKVIWTNLANAIAVYNNVPQESTWDALFHEAVVRLLTSVLSMALAGKPDVAEAYLQSSAAFEAIGETRAG